MRRLLHDKQAGHGGPIAPQEPCDLVGAHAVLGVPHASQADLLRRKLLVRGPCRSWPAAAFHGPAARHLPWTGEYGSSNRTRRNTARTHVERGIAVRSEHARSAWARSTMQTRSNLTLDGQKIAPRDAHGKTNGCPFNATPASPHPSALNIARRCARGRSFDAHNDKTLQH